jgi:hypothetical protein
MAVTRRFDAQIVVPCESAVKQAIEALADQEGISNADVIRQCIDAHLPALAAEYAAKRKRPQSHRLAG